MNNDNDLNLNLHDQIVGLASLLILDSAGCLHFTGYGIVLSGSGTSLDFALYMCCIEVLVKRNLVKLNIAHKCEALAINSAYTHSSAVLVIFSILATYLLRNKQSHVDIQSDFTVLFAYQIKSNISSRES